MVLDNGSHFDAMIGSDPIADFLFQILSQFPAPGNTAAADAGGRLINDMYAGKGPRNRGTGFMGLRVTDQPRRRDGRRFVAGRRCDCGSRCRRAAVDAA